MIRGHKAVAYIRVSVVGDRAARGRFESPDLQREAIDRWAAQQGVEVAGEYQDLNRSGGTMTRPGIQQAVEMVRSGAVKGIIVARSDRASRDTGHGLELIDLLDSLGGWIAACDGSIDTTTRMGRFMTTIAFANARQELDRFREQSAEVHRRAIVEKGRHMGPAPFGYLRGEEGRLVPDPDREVIVVMIYERRAAGAGWSTIAQDLERAGVRRANGGRLTSHAVSRMVKLRVYLGEAKHGEWVTKDAHQPLVSVALWTRANRAQPPVAAAPWTGRRHEESLLRGLLRCAGCRYSMKRLPSHHDRPPRWVCRTLASDGGAAHDCANPARLTPLEGVEAERRVVRACLAVLSSDEGFEEQGPQVDMTALDSAVDEAAALLDELSSLDLRRELGADRWSRMVSEARTAHTDAVQAQDAGAAARTAPTGDAKQVAAAWGALSPERQAEALRSMVKAVMVVGQGAVDGRLFLIRRHEPLEIPRRGHRFIVEPWRYGTPGAPGLLLEAGADDPSEVP